MQIDILELLEARIEQNAKRGNRSLGRDNYGQISNMAMPAGWVPGEQIDNFVGNSSYKQFHPATDKNVRLSFYYRGRRTTAASGQRFHALLKEPCHLLSRKEIDTLAEIIRDKSNQADFRMQSARTEDINGKRVLVIEGRYNEIEQDCRSMFVDADASTGTVVQEISYQAPKASFYRYYGQAKGAMDSIQWK